MSDVMTISKRTAAGLEEVLRTLLLDAESKVPADRLRIVGAIAEGAIIEQGSNSNGEWVRLTNGTQVCIIRKSIQLSETAFAQILNGNVYVWWPNFQYPATFLESPACISSSQAVEGTYTWSTVASAGTGTAVLSVYGSGDARGKTLALMLIAIGRWKA